MDHSFLLPEPAKASFKVIYNRKNLLYDIFRSIFVHLGFFLFCTFAEVIKLCHLTSKSVCQIFDLLVFFIFFLSCQRKNFLVSFLYSYSSAGFFVFLFRFLLRLLPAILLWFCSSAADFFCFFLLQLLLPYLLTFRFFTAFPRVNFLITFYFF